MLILGIETTCDETSAAVVRDGREVLSNVVASQIELHAKFGGVVPEVAARAHLESLNLIVEEAVRGGGFGEPGRELDGVAVANCPGLIGCLLVGTAAAKGLAFAWNKPLLAVNHVQAHLYSVLLRQGGGRAAPLDVPFPAVGLVMSGGHSSLYLVESFHDLKRIGQTQDDAVGEAFDKVAAILQLGYPGGPLIDKLAERGDARAVKLPLSHLEKESLNFSFSGLKTAVLYYVNGKKGRERDASAMSLQQKADVAASFQRVAAEMLTEKLRRAATRYPARSLIIGGGVSANSAIRQSVVELGRELGLPVFIPPMRYCTDNGAMIAGMGYELLASGRVADLDLETVATV
jgi:N6-L-threonylcarbamoyladenine synthase